MMLQALLLVTNQAEPFKGLLTAMPNMGIVVNKYNKTIFRDLLRFNSGVYLQTNSEQKSVAEWAE